MRIDRKAAGCATLGLIGIFVVINILDAVVRAGYGMHLIVAVVISGIWLALYTLSKMENDEKREDERRQ